MVVAGPHLAGREGYCGGAEGAPSTSALPTSAAARTAVKCWRSVSFR
jgi:hypothetical protein